MFIKSIASIIPSGKPGFNTLMKIARTPIKKPKMYLPFSVLADVTGSVAINTAPKQKPPRARCSYQGMWAIAVSGPQIFNTQAIKAPPTKTDTIVFQLATPVHNRITAPISMAITLVSPIEPGMRPVTISQENGGQPVVEVAVEANPKLVAAVIPATVFPSPKILLLATHTASPLIFGG